MIQLLEINNGKLKKYFLCIDWNDHACSCSQPAVIQHVGFPVIFFFLFKQNRNIYFSISGTSIADFYEHCKDAWNLITSIKCKMAKPKFGARFAVITADLEEYLVSCPVPLLPLVWIPACAFTTPHLRGSGVSLAPSCGVRGSFIFIAGLVLQRPSRERISSPRAATVCARLPGSTRRRRYALGLREELRIGQERGGCWRRRITERSSGAPAHITVSSQTCWSASTEMASPAAGHDVPKPPPPRSDSERAEPSHPEPACQEAQKWIEVSD